jgi:hypothetical protein
MRGIHGYLGLIATFIVGASAVVMSLGTTETSTHVDIWSNPYFLTGIGLVVFPLILLLIFMRPSRSPGISYLTYAGQLENANRILDSGNSSITMRKLAVGTLWGMLHESSELHTDVVSILTNFVRSKAMKTSRKKRPDFDVQAALTALAHRPRRTEGVVLDLSATNLAGAVLCGANLRYADLCDSNLSGALLCGADLSNANLQSADLSHAWLNKIDRNSTPEMDARVPQGARWAWISRATTRGKVNSLECTIPRKSSGANLSGANMTSVKLTDANLYGARVDENQSLPPEWTRDSRSGLAVRNL